MTMRDGRDDVFVRTESSSPSTRTVTGFAGRAEGAFTKGLPLPSGGRKPAQRAASFDGAAVKSAFALLSQKVTKAI